MNHAFDYSKAENPETLLSAPEQRIRTVRVKQDMCLSVIKIDPSASPVHPLAAEQIQSISGIYGVCVDGKRNILQILFDGKPETERRFLRCFRHIASGQPIG